MNRSTTDRFSLIPVTFAAKFLQTQVAVLVVGLVPLLTWFVDSQVWAQQTERTTEVEIDRSPEAVAAGRDLLLNYPFLPRDFHQSVFDELWKDWPEPLRTDAANASPEQRLQMAFKRFGFSSRDQDPNKALQYVVDDEGYWSMNCFACHGGRVAGQVVEGLPNAQIALETLYADIRRTKKRLQLPFSQMDRGALVVPMGTTVGTSNAVVFGITLMAFRDKDLDLKLFPRPPIFTNHDMDAPPWWNVSKRDRLYIDGFVEKSHRALIPFVMDQRNSGKKMRGWDDDFKKVFAYIESLEPPEYPFDIDQELAAQGRAVFQTNCASCHGTYDQQPTYPSRIVPIEEIGTDPVRLRSLSVEHRQGYHESWYANYTADETVVDPGGYQAPPLDGVWASAPYFHNGSVPTLWHILNPDQRPRIWRRPDNDAYDQQKVGLAIEALEKLPAGLRGDLRREYFDSSVRGKSAAGHDYPARLSDQQRNQLLEYLKTL